MSDTGTTQRQAFEDWISSPPYERELDRFPSDRGFAWPDQYRDLAVELAWEAWQESYEQVCKSHGFTIA